MPAHLDEPASSPPIDPLCFFVRGWLSLDSRQSDVVAIEAWAGGTQVGETAFIYVRPDVSASLGLPPTARTGFELFAHHPTVVPAQPFALHIRARFHDGTCSPLLAQTTVATIARDYRQHHFGILLDQATTAIQREENIFATGPSQAQGSGELAALLRRYLGPPPRRIIDVGCGIGSYGRDLLAEGYDWLGAEIDAKDCEELTRLGLPHRQVDGRTLPFPDDAFDSALCIEVLEHISDPEGFLREVRRVSPRQLIVSVPNCELLGYLWAHLAAPWHMLESTHVNYFTRWSLAALLRRSYAQVAVRLYGGCPLRTTEGTPLHYHLLAVASNPAPEIPS